VESVRIEEEWSGCRRSESEVLVNRVWKVATIIFALTTAALWSHPRQIAAPSSEHAPSSRLDRAVLTR
jgi:hypothetical protein